MAAANLSADALFDQITGWAGDRNLIEGSNPQAQMLKLIEEIGELAKAIAKGDLPGQIDGVGDAMVVLTILSSQLGFRPEEALAAAYEEIKDRKGQVRDGIFLKESDLLIDVLADDGDSGSCGCPPAGSPSGGCSLPSA